MARHLGQDRTASSHDQASEETTNKHDVWLIKMGAPRLSMLRQNDFGKVEFRRPAHLAQQKNASAG